MASNFSVGSSTLHPGCAGLSSYLSLDCVWELARTHVGLTAGLGLVAILVVRYSKSPWRRVPPGPRGLPLLGNILELQDKDWLFRRDCKQKYSEFPTFVTYIVFTSSRCSRRYAVLNCSWPAHSFLE
jgi:hypothetical protein